jgi:hypothetical protein
LNSLRRISLRNNQISDIGPLVEMADKDFNGEDRFARYWTVSLQGNPLSEQAKTSQIKALEKYSLRIQSDGG